MPVDPSGSVAGNPRGRLDHDCNAFLTAALEAHTSGGHRVRNDD
jgi:hypothetical protein